MSYIEYRVIDYHHLTALWRMVYRPGTHPAKGPQFWAPDWSHPELAGWYCFGAAVSIPRWVDGKPVSERPRALLVRERPGTPSHTNGATPPDQFLLRAALPPPRAPGDTWHIDLLQTWTDRGSESNSEVALFRPQSFPGYVSGGYPVVAVGGHWSGKTEYNAILPHFAQQRIVCIHESLMKRVTTHAAVKSDSHSGAHGLNGAHVLFENLFVFDERDHGLPYALTVGFNDGKPLSGMTYMALDVDSPWVRQYAG